MIPMFNESLEIVKAREDLKRATDALAYFNMDDSSNYLDDREKEDLPKRLKKAVDDAQKRLGALLNTQSSP